VSNFKIRFTGGCCLIFGRCMDLFFSKGIIMCGVALRIKKADFSVFVVLCRVLVVV